MISISHWGMFEASAHDPDSEAQQRANHYLRKSYAMAGPAAHSLYQYSTINQAAQDFAYQRLNFGKLD